MINDEEITADIALYYQYGQAETLSKLINIIISNYHVNTLMSIFFFHKNYSQK